MFYTTTYKYSPVLYLFLLLYPLYVFVRISIKFTHPVQNILELFKSKIYKSAPSNIG